MALYSTMLSCGFIKTSQRILNRRSISIVSRLEQQAAGGGVKGQIAQKTPTRILCEEGKTYNWCACGLSGKQPFCDGSHKRSSLGLTPIQFKPAETKEYFLCNCKQTNNRPFCDGTHKKL